jgi:ornithine cyclodeaminase/alanine dehydrogenase-like protein (mu-crystallin family)
MPLTKAINVLTRCEADLRELLAAAANSGDYDAVLRITSWAKQIALMLGAVPAATPKNQPTATSVKKSAVRHVYPQFLRRGDHLVKIGWSKREKSEYEHKAPRQAALALARAVAEVGKDGRIFQVNALLPLIDPKDGSEVPGYQVYLLVAWWRGAGLLDQHGRQGYSTANASQMQKAVESAWMKLPER